MEPMTTLEELLTHTVRRADLHRARRPIEFPQGMTETLQRAHREVDLIAERLADEDTDVSTLTAHVTEVERLKRRVEAVQLRLTAKASAARAHDKRGRLDTGSWLADVTDTDRRQASGHAALADALGDRPSSGDGGAGNDGAGDTGPGTSGAAGGAGGATDAGEAGADDTGADEAGADDTGSGEAGAGEADTAPRRPHLTATGAALDSGTISTAHAQVIMRALDELPERVTDEQRRTCEEQLLRLCTNRSPGQLRRAARRVLEAIEPAEEVVDQHEDDLVADEEERAREAAAFWIKDNQDGTVTGHFTVPWVSGMMLKKVIDAMTAPRRSQGDTRGRGPERGAGSNRSTHGAGSNRSASGAGERTDDTTADTAADTTSTRKDRYLDWQHRRGLAFADLLTHLPTDHLHTKVAATMIITTRLQDLMDNFEAMGTKVATTDMHDVLSAGAARRLACGAGLLPAVLDGDSVPLDLGRQRRLFTEHQRLALAGRYEECAAEGCDRPFAWTEIHHLRPWAAGGCTDLDEAVPLCGTHHHMVDSPLWSIVVTRLAGRRVSIAFHRRT